MSSTIVPSFMENIPIESPSTNSVLRCSSVTEARVEGFSEPGTFSNPVAVARTGRGVPL